MKQVLASMRESKRYLAFNFDQKLPKDDAKIKINKLFKDTVGFIGMAKADLRLVGNLFVGNKGVIAVSPKYVQELIFSLALSDNPRIETLGVSGVINKTKRFLK